jgi:hypothetical protein
MIRLSLHKGFELQRIKNEMDQMSHEQLLEFAKELADLHFGYKQVSENVILNWGKPPDNL